MKHQAEIDFFVQIMKNFQLPCHFISSPFDEVPDLDLGLRRLLDPKSKLNKRLENILSQSVQNKIYYVLDQFNCNYIFMELPDCEPRTFLFVGPYLTKAFSESELYNKTAKYNVPAGLLKQIELYFHTLPLLPEHGILLNVVTTLGEKLWGDTDNFSIEKLGFAAHDNNSIISSFAKYQDEELPAFSVKRIEERYEIENQFIQAVAQGNFLKAEKLITPYSFTNQEPRAAESLRNDKNYTIILNTLLRKAAELGSVHPYHIHTLSSRFARKIETTVSAKEIEQLHREMIHKYCLLVKNHSMKNYSLLVRKVLTQIETDLTTNLTLNALASELNVNSSYLSTLFKKEVGMTLTEFVNKKRIDHALLLLNTTAMQVQTISQQCGISDVNYFTKLFKKQIGKTPKEYRESLATHK